MTREEFSSGFDTILDSYTTDNGVSIELNEYEKSFFLTQALQSIVKELYGGSTLGFECDEATRRKLESLVITSNPQKVNTELKPVKATRGFKHTIYNLPQDCWYIVYEEIDGSGFNCSNITTEVLPVTHDDYTRIVKNPFRGPTSSRVLRLDKGSCQVELISNFNIDDNLYLIRYIKKPNPIILEDMPIDVSIDGAEPIYDNDSDDSDDSESTPKQIIGYKAQDCELPELLHWEILLTAAQLAIARKALYNSKS